MRDDFGKFTAHKATILVVVKDSAENVRAYFDKEKLPFAGLPDPEAQVARRYGQQWKLLKLGLIPALFVIDRSGTIVFDHYSSSMSDIPANTTVLKALDGAR